MVRCEQRKRRGLREGEVRAARQRGAEPTTILVPYLVPTSVLEPTPTNHLHGHGSCLPDTMAAVLRLTVVNRVEVQVMKDHRVRRRQVDPEAACSSGKREEYKV